MGEMYRLVSNELSDVARHEVFRLLIKVFILTVLDRSSLTEKELDVQLKIFSEALSAMLKKAAWLVIYV